MKYINEFLHINKTKLFNIITDLMGVKKYEYNENTITVLDSMLKNNNTYMCTIEQEKFYKEFFNEADKVSLDSEPYINNELYKQMEQKFKDLDIYLGSVK